MYMYTSLLFSIIGTATIILFTLQVHVHIHVLVVFNVGEYRRQATDSYQGHEFFRSDNAEGLVIRQYLFFLD